MTYSIVARDVGTGQLGAAIQSAAFRAGVDTLWVEAGVGAVATQSFTDPAYGPLCLLALRTGSTAAQALRGAVRRDGMSAYRQVGVVAATGTAAAHTGAACIAEAGHVHRAGVSCQANMMASDRVWPAMLDGVRGRGGHAGGPARDRARGRTGRGRRLARAGGRPRARRRRRAERDTVEGRDLRRAGR